MTRRGGYKPKWKAQQILHTVFVHDNGDKIDGFAFAEWMSIKHPEVKLNEPLSNRRVDALLNEFMEETLASDRVELS